MSTFVTPRAVDSAIAAPKRRRRLGRPHGAWWAWVVFIIGATYFIVPLIATVMALALSGVPGTSGRVAAVGVDSNIQVTPQNAQLGEVERGSAPLRDAAAP